MDFSKIKNIFTKDGVKKTLEFVKKHVRYFAAGALFVVLVLVLVQCAAPQKNAGNGGLDGTEITEEAGMGAFEENAYEDVNALISQYYTAYAAGDIAALSAIATPISDNEQSYITMFSQYIEEYQNINCYTKHGLDDHSYLVSVAMEIKFAGVDTTAPGLDFFYVRTNEQGQLYIDNLYSTYNLTNKENALDTSVQSLVMEFEKEEDVIALQKEVQGRFDTAVAADENLSNMISATLPDAINNWLLAISNQTTEAPVDGTEVAEETEAEEPTTETTENQEETPEDPVEETTTETVYATDKVNVRSAASTGSSRLGSVQKGASVTRTGTDGEWSIIDYNGETGYIKSEFLTTEAPGGANEEEADSTGIEEGTTITLQSTVNVRSGMSETSDKIGTAYAGEKVKVVMSYAEGWTKVTWKDKTGYIKTSLLQ